MSVRQVVDEVAWEEYSVDDADGCRNGLRKNCKSRAQIAPHHTPEGGDYCDFKTDRTIGDQGQVFVYCLVAVTLSSGSYSLLGQGTGQGTALGGHSGEEGFSGGAVHRQLCFATSDCGNPNQGAESGTAPIGIGSFTLSPQNAPTLVFDDAGAGTGAGNPIDIFTSNSTGAQAWSWNNTGVTPPGFYNFAALGANCVTASGSTSGSAVVLDPCAGALGQAWDPVLIGKFLRISVREQHQSCSHRQRGGGGERCRGWKHAPAPAINYGRWLWKLNSSNTGKGVLRASPCTGIGDLSVGGVSYRLTWCQEFDAIRHVRHPAPKPGILTSETITAGKITKQKSTADLRESKAIRANVPRHSVLPRLRSISMATVIS